MNQMCGQTPTNLGRHQAFTSSLTRDLSLTCFMAPWLLVRLLCLGSDHICFYTYASPMAVYLFTRLVNEV